MPMLFKKYAVKMNFRLGFLAIIFLFVNTVFAQEPIAKKRGKVTTHYANGNKESFGKVKNHKRQGVWKYWNPSGQLEKTITYVDDVKNGLYTEYLNDGKKYTEGNFANGFHSGTWITWYPNGKISSKLNYYAVCDKGGECYDGIQQWWDEQGQLMKQESYTKSKINYSWSWYKNGNPHSYEFFENGLKDGTWLMYADPSIATDTFPSSIDNYSNGKREGRHASYSHGKLAEECFYKNDLLDGVSKKWDANGFLIFEENYKNGNLNGKSTYYNLGKPVRIAEFQNGRLTGEEKRFDGSGKVIARNWYKLGQIDSAFTYHPNEKMATSRCYSYYPGVVRTEEFSVYKQWDDKGHLMLLGNYHFSQKDKTWTTYYPNGNVRTITPYVGGKEKGLYKRWYVNGKEMIEYECDGMKAVTTPKVWDEKGRPLKSGIKAYQEIVDSSLPGDTYDEVGNSDIERRKIPVNLECISNVDELNFPDQDFENRKWDQRIEPQEADPVFQYVEVMPVFPGGNDSMMKFIQRNLKYPSIDGYDKHGTVYLGFVVERDGSISNIKELKGVAGAPELTKEAIRVVSMFPKFSPGKMNGRPVRVQFNLPVKFVMQ